MTEREKKQKNGKQILWYIQIVRLWFKMNFRLGFGGQNMRHQGLHRACNKIISYIS